MLAFDPYEQWLQIPVERRPASPYDLLGLPDGEASEQRIFQAAAQRVKLVRKYVLSPDALVAEQANRILGELAAATVSLLPPKPRQPDSTGPRRVAATVALPGLAKSPFDEESILDLMMRGPKRDRGWLPPVEPTSDEEAGLSARAGPAGPAIDDPRSATDWVQFSFQVMELRQRLETVRSQLRDPTIPGVLKQSLAAESRQLSDLVSEMQKALPEGGRK